MGHHLARLGHRAVVVAAACLVQVLRLLRQRVETAEQAHPQPQAAQAGQEVQIQQRQVAPDLAGLEAVAVAV